MREFSSLLTFVLASWLSIALSAEPLSSNQRLAVNGVELSYAIYGQGSPVLLLHGGLGHSGAWTSQVEALKSRFQVITMDSRGHGRSSFDETPISYTVMAGDVLALLDRLNIKRCAIVGWSDGAIIGLELAIRHPERLGKLVAYGANYHPSGVRDDIGENTKFSEFTARAASDYQTLSPAPERWQEFLDNIGQMWASQPDFSVNELGAIESDVLVLAGTEEEAIYISHVQATARLIPGSRLALIHGTGHFAHWERSDEFNRIVLDFLE